MRRIGPHFLRCQGIQRVGPRIKSGIIFILWNGLIWCDAPADYGSHKTISNQSIRWGRLGVVIRIFAELADKGVRPDQLMIWRLPSQCKPYGSKPAKKETLPRSIVWTNDGLISKLHAVRKGKDLRLITLLREGQTSDYKMGDPNDSCLPRSQGVAGRPGLGCLLVLRRAGAARHRPVHPIKGEPQRAHPARHGPLSTASKYREHVRQTQGLAPPPYLQRPVHSHVTVHHLQRCNRHLLAVAMSPERD